MKRLYLIDGHAQFFRAYHAIRTPMTSPVTKEPTNATYGFVGMLLKLFRECTPDYVAVAIDVSGDRGTFRSEIYPAYKATRDEPPENLPVQIQRCLSILEAAKIPVLGVEGFEADDVIATLADELKGEDVAIRIVSKDKDLAQLLERERVEMYDVPSDTPTTVETLAVGKGVTPAQVIDMLALMGDTVDNVPGVPGIGPKTAAQLIQQYGSLDALLSDAENIKGKRGENIRSHAEMLETSRELVTLRHDVPIDFALKRAAIGSFDMAALMPILKELGFNRYQEDLKSLAGTKGEPARGSQSDGEADGTLFATAPEAGALETPSGDYTCVKTREQLEEMVGALKKAECVAMDTETTSLLPMSAQLVGLSFAVEPEAGWYVPVRSPEPESHLDEETVIGALKPVLEDPSVDKTGHNLKYDILVLRACGVRVRGVSSDIAHAEDIKESVGVKAGSKKATNGFDSMIASFLIDASRSSHSLDNLSLAILNHACTPISDLIGTGKKQRTFDTVTLDRATMYAAEDADISLRLRNELKGQLEAMGLETLFRRVELPLTDVLAELQWNGIRVDPGELDAQAERLNARIGELRDEIADASPRDFNPDSPKQLQSVLFNKPGDAEPGLGLKPLKKTKTGYSTDVEVLEKLAGDPDVESPVPGLIVEYRQLTKLVGTYLTALKEAINPKTGRVHASFNQTVAATGRLSSSEPNLQNIPIRTDLGREIRRAFVAEAGHVLIGADYSQIELRVLAHMSGDDNLIEAFNEGQDIHRAVAAQIHGVNPDEVTGEQRSGAKMVNFGIVYGITPYGLARRLGVSNDEASTIIDEYKARFPGITTFLQACIDQAKEHGYVTTMLGRRRPIPEIDARNPNRRSLSERMAINSVVQGTAADLIKLAMLDLHARLSPSAGHLRDEKPPELEGVRMLLQIHDELVFECPKGIAEAARDLIVARMEAAMVLDVPLVVESSISENWFEGK